MPAHSATIALLRCLLLTSIVLATSARAQDALQLTFSRGQHKDGAHSTQPYLQLAASSGVELVLQRSSGKDYQVQKSNHGWTWFQVQQVPQTETHIAVTPQVDGKQVTLDIKFLEVRGDEHMLYSSAVSGTIGIWITLLDNGTDAPAGGGKRYSSAGAADRLFVKVDRQP